jgi:hypothetical protein
VADRRLVARIVEPVSEDFLDEMIDERTLANPAFRALLDAAVQRRRAETEPAADPGAKAK